MYCVCIYATLYNIFIKKRENAREMNAINLHNSNMYVKDVVAVFKLFTRAHPPVKEFHTITTTLLRRRCAAIHTSLRLL